MLGPLGVRRRHEPVNAHVATTPHRTADSASVPTLRPARLDDYDKIRHLAFDHALEFPDAEDWRRLWLANPLTPRHGPDSPIGWVLETPAGEIVGHFGSVRTLYKLRGDDVVAAAGRAWIVTAAYRGFALQLVDEYFNQAGVDVFINNAVSAPAVASFDLFSRRIPLGAWESMSYWITTPLARAGEALRRLSAPAPGAFAIDAADRFDSRFDAFWRELLRQKSEMLLAERSRRALTWHFDVAMRRQRLHIVTASRNGQLRAYCILTRHEHGFQLPPFPRRDTQGVRGMRLVDYQSIEPEVDLLPRLLAAALRRCAQEGLFMLEHFGRGVPKMRALDDHAPYRKALTNWKFFYRAADPRLDADLREPERWDPSAYDGEASLD